MSASEHRYGFSVTANRESKAKKIMAVLSECGRKFSADAVVLDIGTGNGGIAYFLGEKFKIVSVDIVDQRANKENYLFSVCNENLPFFDAQFDIVISNHIIEHVADAELHLSEIARVLKKDGVVYLATPNKLWPWEVHYRVPLLHYLPQSLFMTTLKLLKKYREDIHLFTWHQLLSAASPNFDVSVFSDKICRNPDRYAMNVKPWMVSLLQILPLRIYSCLTLLHPTLVTLMKKAEKGGD